MARPRFGTAFVLVIFVALIGGFLYWVYQQPLRAPVSSRALLPSNADPGEEFGAYGFVVFTRQPRTESRRDQRVCRAFLRHFPSLAEYPTEDPLDLMVVYWPIRERPSRDDVNDCSVLLDLYDFARANKLAVLAGVAGVKGPVLIGFADEVDGGFTLDLSDFQPAEISRGFRIWKGHVSRDPSKWRDGIKLTRIREAFRNLIQRHGASILKAIPAR